MTTRGEFRKKMLKTIFKVSNIKYQSTDGSTVKFSANGGELNDCTYSIEYKVHQREMFQTLLDKKYNCVQIESRKEKNGYPIEEYQKRAIDFVFDFLKPSFEAEPGSIELWELAKDAISLELVKEIYLNVILEKLFAIGEKPKSKERRNDKFDESYIEKSIRNYMKSSKIFLSQIEVRCIVHDYPTISRLELDLTNQLFVEQVIDREYFLKFSKRIHPQNVHFEIGDDEVVSNIRKLNEILHGYSCQKELSMSDFESLEECLVNLCIYSEKFIDVISMKELDDLTDEAVSVYNHVYGKRNIEHRDYTEYVHSEFIEYLLMLDLNLQAYRKYGIN
ncbi:MAG: hypothetical protein K2I06_02875 [Ruminococcus sp.]|nr:hypothetical protein [Ruminococcus sp.]